MFKDENRFIKFKPLAHWVSILQGLLGFFSIEIITGILAIIVVLCSHGV
ncbi:unnamed protein product [Arabidopsis lyrata]|nr:unnamed protein product [Arabidopsis lyrata]